MLLAMLLAVSFVHVGAQSRSLGSTWSFSGIGLAYEHITDNQMIIHAGVQMELAENFIGRRGRPGVSCSVTWSSIIAQTESRNGNTVLFHAGTGIMTGWCKDYIVNNEPDPYGIAFGLQGRLGTTIIYDRNINISISILPVIGIHLTKSDETMNMKYYRYGLLRTIMPEIGIQYRF